MKEDSLSVLMHFVLGIIIGGISVFIGSGKIALVLAVIVLYILKKVIDKRFGKKEIKWWLGNGFFIYIFMWLASWIFLYNAFVVG